ncbi:hypothetical protein PENSTE_c003G10084 [Penicillium steckii]|uniref:Uncharacterized protein n=1 Tax=Penicillium steckii TaxID=303698 RepID=A0A1V6TRH4_9EURO|nr:hypothetical protein PENSTE_c003G10084 [Penicillium steckii]
MPSSPRLHRRKAPTRSTKDKLQGISKCEKKIRPKATRSKYAIPSIPNRRVKASSFLAKRDALQDAIGEAIHSVFLGDLESHMDQLRENLHLCQEIYKRSISAIESVDDPNRQQEVSCETSSLWDALAGLKLETEEAIADAEEVLAGYQGALDMSCDSPMSPDPRLGADCTQR